MEGERAPTWECLFAHRMQGLILSVYVDGMKKGRVEAEHGATVEKLDETSWSDEPSTFLDQEN